MKKLIILDIDETLVYASGTKIGRTPDFMTPLYHVYKRPYLHEFLDYCFAHFDVAIWTTAGSDFAEMIYREIISQHGELVFLWSYAKCTVRFNPELQDTTLIKNLKKVKKLGYPLEHVIMVDDTPAKLQLNYGNQVCVSEFLGDKSDDEFKHLIPFLDYLSKADNIRRIEKRNWRRWFQVDH